MPTSNEVLLKKIQDLENKVNSLEKDRLNMFGRSYAQYGTSQSDFLIKTRGQVKIQYGNKFIDLIKNGKINVDVKFLYTVDNVEAIDKNGIYIIDDSVYVKLDDKVVNIAGEAGTTYVSFLENQETDSTAKYNALTNIGFLYKDMENVSDSALKNGIIYVESEKKLYIVVNGVLTEYSFELPNPFTTPITISQNGDAGALIIKGTGAKNGIKFDNLQIYQNTISSNFESKFPIKFIINGSEVFTIDSNGIKLFGKYIDFQSSTTNVDNLIEDYLEYYFTESNVIVEDGDTKLSCIYKKVSDSGVLQDAQTYNIALRYENTFKPGDLLITYIDKQPYIFKYEGEYVEEEEPENPDETGDSNDETKDSDDESDELVITNPNNFDDDFSENDLAGHKIFLYQRPKAYILKAGNGELIYSTLVEEEKTDEESESESESESEEKEPSYIYKELLSIKDGKFTTNTIAQYASDMLSPEDDSESYASTRWVNRKVQSTIDIDFTINDIVVDKNTFTNLFRTGKFNNEFVSVQENPSVKTYIGKYGVVTVSKDQPNKMIYSGVIRAKTDTNTWSYRTMYGEFVFAPDEENPENTGGYWLVTNTYLIKDLFIPGYYYAEDTEGKNYSYIGTTNTGTTSQERPFILYSNDSKTWSLVDKWTKPDLEYYFVVSNGIVNFVNQGESNLYPAGNIGAICESKGIEKEVVLQGKTNYVPLADSEHLVLTVIPETLRNVLTELKKQGLKFGVVPKIQGGTHLFRIAKSKLDNIQTISAKNDFEYLGSQGTGRSLPEILTCLSDKDNTYGSVFHPDASYVQWVDKDYKVIPSSTRILPHDFWNASAYKDKLCMRVLAGYLMRCVINGSNQESDREGRLNALYSPHFGWFQGYEDVALNNYTGTYTLQYNCQTYPSPPASDEAPNNISSCNCEWRVRLQIFNLFVEGTIMATYTSPSEFEAESKPSNAAHLCGKYGLGTLYNTGEEYSTIVNVLDTITWNLKIFTGTQLYIASPDKLTEIK